MLNDEFKLGLQIDVKKKSLKLYTHFGNSDIILASPIGLKMLKSDSKKNNKTGEAEGAKEKEVNYGYLSSVEILYLEKAHVFNMQNLDHLVEILQKVSDYHY
jgi:U3 small nucleolar RNA-associated protein 25